MSYEFKKRGRRNDLKLITQRDEIFRYLYEEFNAQLIPLKNRLNKGENEKILGKAPTKRNWQVLTEVSRYEEFGINGRRQNAGLITGDETRLIVVDVDNQSIFSEKYQLPETLTVRTGKGFHHYFKIPDNYHKGVLKCKSIQGSGFDIRANGGYVVAGASDSYARYLILLSVIPLCWGCFRLAASCSANASSNFALYLAQRSLRTLLALSIFHQAPERFSRT